MNHKARLKATFQTLLTDFYGQCKTHPASLLNQPGVELLSDDLENPADDESDVFKMVGGQ